MPVTLQVVAQRNLDFAPTFEFEYEGDAPDLTGATATMQVRLYPGAPDPVEVEDSSVTIADAAHATDAGWRTLTLSPSIAKADLLAMPTAAEAGEPDTFYYEIKLTYADSAQDSLFIGEFVLEPGVNDT